MRPTPLGGGRFAFACRYDQATVGAPVFPPVSPVLRPVISGGLFPRYFNDLSCISRVLTPCKSPVIFCNWVFNPHAASSMQIRLAGVPAHHPGAVEIRP